MRLIDPDFLGILGRYWGYGSFRPMQREIIDSVLAGRDTLGLLPTGGGKSITFQVPALAVDGLTIVVTPLISLMKDQADNLGERGIRAYYLHSGMTMRESRLAFDKCRLGKAKILYLSPERLQNQRFRAQLKQLPVALIVVDEAHCISQWGHDFRPSYLRIAELRESFPDAPVLALTASATPQVVEDIMRSLNFRQPHGEFRLSFTRKNISYIVRHCDFKEPQLLRVLGGVPGTAIVYTRSRRRTREVAELLKANGISADYYHAGLLPEEKEERQNSWRPGALGLWWLQTLSEWVSTSRMCASWPMSTSLLRLKSITRRLGVLGATANRRSPLFSRPRPTAVSSRSGWPTLSRQRIL